MTLPVPFKGTEMDAYTPAERLVLSSAANYLGRPDLFPRLPNNNIDAQPLHPHTNPRILRLKPTQVGSGERSYTQLISRRRLHPAETSTEAIQLTPNAALYHFKHESQPTS